MKKRDENGKKKSQKYLSSPISPSGKTHFLFKSKHWKKKRMYTQQISGKRRKKIHSPVIVFCPFILHCKL